MAKLVSQSKEENFIIRQKNKVIFSLQKKRELPYWLNLVIAISVWISIYFSLVQIWNPFIKRLVMVVAIILAYYSVRLANTMARKIVKPSEKEPEKKIVYVFPTEDEKIRNEILKEVTK